MLVQEEWVARQCLTATNILENQEGFGDNHMNWIALDSEDQINQLQSLEKPSLIFKHSTRCNISNMALKFFEKEWDQEADVNLYFLDILANRNLSNKVAEVFQVHHESPQVILIKNGECILDASHQDISASELQEVLSTN